MIVCRDWAACHRVTIQSKNLVHSRNSRDTYSMGSRLMSPSPRPRVYFPLPERFARHRSLDSVMIHAASLSSLLSQRHHHAPILTMHYAFSKLKKGAVPDIPESYSRPRYFIYDFCIMSSSQSSLHMSMTLGMESKWSKICVYHYALYL